MPNFSLCVNNYRNIITEWQTDRIIRDKLREPLLRSSELRNTE